MTVMTEPAMIIVRHANSPRRKSPFHFNNITRDFDGSSIETRLLLPVRVFIYLLIWIYLFIYLHVFFKGNNPLEDSIFQDNLEKIKYNFREDTFRVSLE